MSRRRIKKGVGLFLAIAIPYFLLLLLHSGRWIEVRMQAQKTHVLHPRIYYTQTGQPYSETKSLGPKVVKNGRYMFELPRSVEITDIRFDPDDRPHRHIVISAIKMYVRHGWSQRIYRFSLKTLRPLHDIGAFEQKEASVAMVTTGKDAQLHLPFSPILVERFSDWGLVEAIAALIIFLILQALYRLRMQEALRENMRAKVILYACFLAFILFKAIYYKEHIRPFYPPDELAHLSYVNAMQQQPTMVPHFEHLTLLNNPHQGNYLSHPPLYYLLMSLMYRPGRSIHENLMHCRTLNVALYFLAVVLIASLAFWSCLDIVSDAIFLSLLASLPMHAYIGGSLSNDTLAFLGCAIFGVGLYRLLQEKQATSTYALLALGALLAYFAKLTAALLVFFALLFVLLDMYRQGKRLRMDRGQKAMVFIVLLLIIGYQGYIFYRYHAIVPTFNVTHPEAYLHSPFFVPPEYRHYLSLKEWLVRWLHMVQGGWFGIHSHHSFYHADIWGILGAIVLHLMALVAWFAPCPAQKEAYCRLGKITLLALMVVVVIQLFFSYHAHLKSGYMGGLQPRYLLPFMFGFAIMASIFAERRKGHFGWFLIIIASSLHALYSDFFYFLLYYQ